MVDSQTTYYFIYIVLFIGVCAWLYWGQIKYLQTYKKIKKANYPINFEERLNALTENPLEWVGSSFDAIGILLAGLFKGSKNKELSRIIKQLRFRFLVFFLVILLGVILLSM